MLRKGEKPCPGTAGKHHDGLAAPAGGREVAAGVVILSLRGNQSHVHYQRYTVVRGLWGSFTGHTI